MWLEGPEWLKVPLCSEDEGDAVIPDECMEELRARDQTLVMYSTLNNPTSIIDVTRFSTFRRLRRVIAQMMCFIRLTRAKMKKRLVNCQLSIGDMELAHRILLHVAQADLVKNNRFGSWKHQFSLYQDTEGIWRCRGRLEECFDL